MFITLHSNVKQTCSLSQLIVLDARIVHHDMHPTSSNHHDVIPLKGVARYIELLPNSESNGHLSYVSLVNCITRKTGKI